MSPLLRLKAQDADDLRTISACVQDALVLVGDISFEPEAKRLLIALNRFIWEERSERERIVSILTIEGVEGVKYRGIDRSKPDVILSLLALSQVSGGIELIFSADVTVRIEAAALAVYLADMGESWPTLWQPVHDRN